MKIYVTNTWGPTAFHSLIYFNLFQSREKHAHFLKDTSTNGKI